MAVHIFDANLLSDEPDPEYFRLDPYSIMGDLFGPACQFCGCTEFNACPGGCAWSKRYVEEGRAVCTRCEGIALTIDVNFGVLDIWRRQLFLTEVRV